VSHFTLGGYHTHCLYCSLRWFEDAVSSFRAFTALRRLLSVGRPTLQTLRTYRDSLQTRVSVLAITLGLPADPEAFFVAQGSGREKGRIRGKWEGRVKYFSLRRRRKRDWNETLRLYDVVDYPEDPTN
jgi:glycerol-3-phosphate O-acyltransferase/dihydroxyacetone phosphate acyltransferase